MLDYGLTESEALVTIIHESFGHVAENSEQAINGIDNFKNGEFGLSGEKFTNFALFFNSIAKSENEHDRLAENKNSNMEAFLNEVDNGAYGIHRNLFNDWKNSYQNEN